MSNTDFPGAPHLPGRRGETITVATAFEDRYGMQDPDDARWLWTAPRIVEHTQDEFTAFIVISDAYAGLNRIGADEDAARLGYILGFRPESGPQNGDSPRFHLCWTDHVANDWVEHFGTLPIALMRLAALIDCVDTDGTFTDNANGFAAKAALFLEGTND